MTIRLTNSEAVCWRRCKRKWYLTYFRRLKRKVGPAYGSPLSIGNLVHDALAAYYDPALRADPVVHAQVRVNEAISSFPESQFEIEKEWELVQLMLSGYIDWLAETGADQDLRLMGAEKMVEIEFTEGVTLLSKLDAPVEQISDGAKLALEHKTTASIDQPLELLKIDTQLLTEHLVRFLDAKNKGASTEEAYDQCHGIIYNQLKKVKRTARANPPFYKRTTVPHNIHELRNHWKHVHVVAQEIRNAQSWLQAADHHNHFIPNPMKSCSWECDFFKICAMFDDGSRVEAAIEDLYEEHDPLERYEGTEEL